MAEQPERAASRLAHRFAAMSAIRGPRYDVKGRIGRPSWRLAPSLRFASTRGSSATASTSAKRSASRSNAPRSDSSETLGSSNRLRPNFLSSYIPAVRSTLRDRWRHPRVRNKREKKHTSNRKFVKRRATSRGDSRTRESGGRPGGSSNVTLRSNASGRTDTFLPSRLPSYTSFLSYTAPRPLPASNVRHESDHDTCQRTPPSRRHFNSSRSIIVTSMY